jgi:hypothetical protein
MADTTSYYQVQTVIPSGKTYSLRIRDPKPDIPTATAKAALAAAIATDVLGVRSSSSGTFEIFTQALKLQYITTTKTPLDVTTRLTRVPTDSADAELAAIIERLKAAGYKINK